MNGITGFGAPIDYMVMNSDYNARRVIELFEDAKLSRYQCSIETDNGMIDLSLDVQMDNLITALKLMVKEQVELF